MEKELYNFGAEKYVLGSVLYEPELIDELTTKPEFFSPGRHRNLILTMVELREKDIPVDYMSIGERLKFKGENIDQIGGVAYLMELAGDIIGTSSFGYYNNQVTDKYLEREAANIGLQLHHGLDRSEAMAKLQSLEDVGVQDDDDGRIESVLVEVYDEIESSDGTIKGIKYGYRDLDKMVQGLKPGDLVIVAARPSMGKTAFVINVAVNVMQSPNNLNGSMVPIFSYEMKPKKLVPRFMSAYSNLLLDTIKKGAPGFGDEDWRKLTNAMGGLSNTGLRIYKNPGGLRDMRAKVRKLKKENPGVPVMLVVDYLQLMPSDSPSENRTQEVSAISRGLKRLAVEEDITVMALSQLHRGVEQRQDKRPMMSDIRESGQIEQDADIIQFLYRDAYYNEETEDGNMVEVITAKARDGDVGTVKLAFVKELGKFVSIDWGTVTKNGE